ncbi:MAG: DNA mismatch repair endonuclease MutL [Saccharofermentanales bacterium]|nr:DNA mismatch repair endonuclease MutL [Clostridiaceae bacterium]
MEIHILDQQTANSIAAGEVVERPASVVKELVENALDADASVITIEFVQGGIVSIRVTDNGRGMGSDDAMLAFSRHATSKIAKIEDLDSIATMGFRGEALASISAVAKVRLETRRLTDDKATYVVVHGGEMLDSGWTGSPTGTSVLVENLFYNVPARFKFLRKDTTEAGAIIDLVERMALARSDVSFRLLSNNQEILHTPGNNDLISTVYAVYGKTTATACLPVNSTQPPLSLKGLIGRPDLCRNNRSRQSFFVNGRLVRSRTITAALDEAYQTLLMKGKYAVAVLFLDLPSNLVDVNVHPQKMEVRFWSDQDVFRMVYHSLRGLLISQAGINVLPTDENQRELRELQETVPITKEAVGLPLRETAQPTTMPDQRGDYKAIDEQESSTLSMESVVEEQTPIASAPQPLESQPPLLKINDLDRSRLIGQLFNTFLLLELDQELLLIDQHAAHEKVLYEALLARRRQALSQNRPVATQTLLVPIILELSKRELQMLRQEQERLASFGFDFDFFGESSVALRSCPDDGGNRLQPEQAFRLVLDTLIENLPKSGEDAGETLFDLACKAAVKAHDNLKFAEIERLLHDLKQLENPYQCPHGRPVIIRITRYELEKRFKRIV